MFRQVDPAVEVFNIAVFHVLYFLEVGENEEEHVGYQQDGESTAKSRLLVLLGVVRIQFDRLPENVLTLDKISKPAARTQLLVFLSIFNIFCHC